MNFTQLIGEVITYEQDVIGDTITGAVWASDGGTVEPGSVTATSAQCAFSSTLPGTFALNCTLTLASGQVRIGQARIQVIGSQA